jgi:hypothetical protein
MEKTQSLRNEIIGRTNKYVNEEKKKAKNSWYDAREKAESIIDIDNGFLNTDIDKIIPEEKK